MKKVLRGSRGGRLAAALLVCGVFAGARGAAQPARPPIPPDIAGEWRLDNNEQDTTAQPPLGDYLGIPFNDAGRQRSDTTAESLWGTPEYQCRPHSAPHQWRGLGGARILKEQDPLTRNVSVYHVQFMRSLDRPIFMDGRPHPPAYAPHSWTGFSTGEWVGNTLKVTTTHLKDGYLKRGGPQTSDMLTMTEYITRHDEILTIVTVVDDPIYMDEPYVESTTYTIDTTASVAMREASCVFSASVSVATASFLMFAMNLGKLEPSVWSRPTSANHFVSSTERLSLVRSRLNHAKYFSRSSGVQPDLTLRRWKM